MRSTHTNRETPTILFGVTSHKSLKLLGQIPKSFANLGWTVHIVANVDHFETPESLQGIRLHHIRMSRKPSPVIDLLGFVHWWLLLGKVKPTIVSIGTPKAALLGLVAARIRLVPVRVYHLRGLRMQTIPQYAQAFFSATERVTGKSATHILAVSPSLKKEFCKLGLVDTGKISVLGKGSSHGVDTDHFHPKRWADWIPPEQELRDSIRLNIPILGFVGRFSRDKGSREILSCIKSLSKSGIRHTLLIVGPVEGDSALLNELRNSSTVIVVGEVSDVAPYYSIMRLLLLPTYREGLPNVVLEAASSGVPAVTTTATGAIDSVTHGKTGAIVPLGDEVAFVREVQRLLSSRTVLDRMSRNARDRVVSDFSVETVTGNHVKYFARLEEESRF